MKEPAGNGQPPTPQQHWPDALLNVVAQQLVFLGYVAQRTPDRLSRLLLAFVGVVFTAGGVAELLWGRWPPAASILMLSLGGVNLLTLLLYYLFRRRTP